jgi:hypothetical protein
VPGSEDFKIIVSRENGDANGSLVILIWEILPPPAIDPIILVLFPPFLIPSIFSMIIFWKIATTKTSRRSIRPFWVAILVIVGLALVSPYITGSLGGFFTPTDVIEQVLFERRTLVLDGSQPSGLVPFGNEVPNDTESFRIHSFVDDDRRYHFELVGANDELVLSATHENSSIAWEILGNSVSQDHALILVRVDIDADVSFTIEASATAIKSPVNPLPSTFLALTGVGSLILAIVLSFSVRVREDSEVV